MSQSAGRLFRQPLFIARPSNRHAVLRKCSKHRERAVHTFRRPEVTARLYSFCFEHPHSSAFLQGRIAIGITHARETKGAHYCRTAVRVFWNSILEEVVNVRWICSVSRWLCKGASIMRHLNSIHNTNSPYPLLSFTLITR